MNLNENTDSNDECMGKDFLKYLEDKFTKTVCWGERHWGIKNNYSWVFLLSDYIFCGVNLVRE